MEKAKGVDPVEGGGNTGVSLINDIALGLPGAATSLALGMYSLCVAAESAANPAALKAIGDLLKDPSWERSAKPSVAVNRIFVWTFGERHLSWKCLRRSVFTTIIIFIAILLFNYRSNENMHLVLTSVYKHPIIFLVHVLLIGVLSDYLALAKSRFFIRKAAGGGSWFIIMLIFADILASIAIAFILYIVYILIISFGYFWFWLLEEQFIREKVPATFPLHLKDLVNSDHFLLSALATLLVTGIICVYSTLFTSFWIISVFFATSCIKVITPLHRFTRWFFDISTHPLKAIGFVAGGLMISVSILLFLVDKI